MIELLECVVRNGAAIYTWLLARDHIHYTCKYNSPSRPHVWSLSFYASIFFLYVLNYISVSFELFLTQNYVQLKEYLYIHTNNCSHSENVQT